MQILHFPRRTLAPTPTPAPIPQDWNTGPCPHCHAPAARYEHETFGCKQERNG